MNNLENKDSNYVLLKQALDMAFIYHANQYREDGTFYVLHPIAVMSKLPTELPVSAKIAALLHDVIEDVASVDEANSRSENILKHFGTQVYGFVDTLSRRTSNLDFDSKEDYSDYINRIKNYQDNIPKLIKLADLEHNIMTIHNIKDKERQTRLSTKYYMSYEFLKDRVSFESLQAVC